MKTKQNTKTKQKMSRWALARRLQDVALRISAGKPVRIGGVSVRVPDQVVLEQEIENKDGQTELEFELKWAVAEERPNQRPARSPLRRRVRRSGPPVVRSAR